MMIIRFILNYVDYTLVLKMMMWIIPIMIIAGIIMNIRHPHWGRWSWTEDQWENHITKHHPDLLKHWKKERRTREKSKK